jgi:hypothetical protein
MRRPTDESAAATVQIARLMEQAVGLQRQVSRLELALSASEARMTALTDAKFVTYRTLIDSQAEKVALALEATEKAIGKAEVATGKAIEKEASANADRFRSVNEFRGQLSDQVATFMPRSEHAVEMAATAERIARMDELIKAAQIWQGNITGRIAILGAVFAVLMTVIVFAANYATRA